MSNFIKCSPQWINFTHFLGCMNKIALLLYGHRLTVSLFVWQEDWVLCRVFHKSKAESSSSSSNNDNDNSRHLSPENMFGNLNSPSDKTFLSSGHFQNITSFSPSPTHHIQNPNFPNSYGHQDVNNFPISEINSKCEDDYSFLLFDPNFRGFDEDNSLVFPLNWSGI